jgi:hypothetical protein
MVAIYLLFSGMIFSQDLKKIPLTRVDSAARVLAKYEYTGVPEGYINLTLFENKRFHHAIAGATHGLYCEGTWEEKDSNIVLTSDFQKTSIPIKLEYLFSGDSAKTGSRCFFQIPVNLKGEHLSDSKVYINDDTAFCFPYFDTCVGDLAIINRIKVDFGNGIKSKWVPVNNGTYKSIHIVAEIDFSLSSYLFLNRKTYRNLGSRLRLAHFQLGSDQSSLNNASL